MNEKTLRELILDTIREVVTDGGAEEITKIQKPQTASPRAAEEMNPACVICDEEVADLSAVDFRKVISVPDPAHPEQFQELREKSAGRIGIWRAGPRYRTESYLRFRADHAAAMDAVFQDVPQALLDRMGLLQVKTLCENKDDYLTRPDKGRMFSQETLERIKKNCTPNPDVQIILADGLSSTAIADNAEDILPAIMQGLAHQNITVGTPFFVKYGRVPAMDPITELLGAKVTVILVGERPGLATRGSMSAYMTYGGYVGMPEAGRTVLSNIHKAGTNAPEAGAYIAELCLRMLKEKVSGLDLVI
ncbi:ethanolamine ammonia-lyase subunit EutC [Anaerotruncus rubiinfantis]|uniref:ethanolamine ammonia-lyase subunit EutC n=1 Tax=Anaerotruncus rubiinfantis TaxID=1720200 RepID=UPI00082CD100|nr:ethanolamine ammonia-lyase subunit EutC [Anaerotruncus rubiinfantis]